MVQGVTFTVMARQDTCFTAMSLGSVSAQGISYTMMAGQGIHFTVRVRQDTQTGPRFSSRWAVTTQGIYFTAMMMARWGISFTVITRQRTRYFSMAFHGFAAVEDKDKG